MKHLSSSPNVLDFSETAEQREFAERTWARAHLLTDADRVLLALHLDAGSSFGQIARLVGVQPTTVARRVRRIVARLVDQTYPICAQNRQRFTESELDIIRDFFVRGLSVARISRDHEVTYYRARAIVQMAQECAASVRSLTK